MYNIIEKNRFSTGNKAAIIRVVAPVQSGSQKMGRSPQNSKPPPAVQSGSVAPYSLVVKYVQKPSNSEIKNAAVKFGSVRVSPYSPLVKKFAVQFGSMCALVQSCKSSFMAPALKEDIVIGSNECKSVVSTRSGLSVSRSFYNMAVCAVTRELVFNVHFICLCVSRKS